MGVGVLHVGGCDFGCVSVCDIDIYRESLVIRKISNPIKEILDEIDQ